MKENTRVNIICGILVTIGILIILFSNSDPTGKIIFFLSIALVAACSVAGYRKEQAGKKQRQIINESFKRQLQALREEGIDT